MLSWRRASDVPHLLSSLVSCRVVERSRREKDNRNVVVLLSLLFPFRWCASLFRTMLLCSSHLCLGLISFCSVLLFGVMLLDEDACSSLFRVTLLSPTPSLEKAVGTMRFSFSIQVESPSSCRIVVILSFALPLVATAFFRDVTSRRRRIT